MLAILTTTEYIEKSNFPKKDYTEEELQQLTNYIEDATNSIDNLCGGKVFAEYPKLDPLNIPYDENRVYKLKRSIMDYTLLLDQTSKMWIAGSQVGGGSAPFSLTTQNANSDVEFRRQDIIKSLVAGDWYVNSRVGGNSSSANRVDPDEQFNKLVAKLGYYFLRTDGENTYNASSTTFPNTNTLNNTGDIFGGDVVDANTHQVRKPVILGYKINNAENSENTNKILDPVSFLYKFINEYDVNYFGGLTEDEINFRITASNILWNAEYTYSSGFMVQFITTDNKYAFANSLIDNNTNNDPNTSPNAWNILDNPAIDIEDLIVQLRPIVKEEVDSAVENLNKVKVYSREQTDNLLGNKQNTLIAGTNIAIDQTTNTISATGGEYEIYLAKDEVVLDYSAIKYGSQKYFACSTVNQPGSRYCTLDYYLTTGVRALDGVKPRENQTVSFIYYALRPVLRDIKGKIIDQDSEEYKKQIKGEKNENK